jgi:hypothetical protein
MSCACNLIAVLENPCVAVPALRENFPLQVGCATHVQLLVKAHVACRKIILVPVTACAEGAVIRVPA